MITLTQDQINAKQQLQQFYASKDKVITLDGSAGVGKTTVIKQIIEEAELYQKTLKFIDPNYIIKDFLLAATTNKAVAVLKTAINNTSVKQILDVKTIHSIMNLRASNGFRVSSKSYSDLLYNLKNKILIIDEASMLTDSLYETLISVADGTNCKIIFIGDSNQLPPVKQKQVSKIFDTNIIKLNQVVRQSNTLLPSVTAFKEYVETGLFPDIQVDGTNILHLDKDSFEAMIKADMSANNWSNTDSRVLVYKNTDVKYYNDLIKSYITGTPLIMPGESVINNKYVNIYTGVTIPTEANVFVTTKKPCNYSINDKHFIGHEYTIIYGNKEHCVWMADSMEDRLKIEKIKPVYSNKQFRSIVDLRAEYASTIHKAQGSTFKRVYIDLNSIKNISKYDLDMFKRLLYVATSRASEQIIFTGDLI